MNSRILRDGGLALLLGFAGMGQGAAEEHADEAGDASRHLQQVQKPATAPYDR